jgi:uncharacterized membrane protein
MVDLRSAFARRHELRYGFLFLPGLIALGFVGAALLVVRLDELGGANGVGIGFEGNAQGARTILSTVAGSLITVAGLAFSITIVSLQLVSQQFSPRAIRTFLGDRVTQVTAGVFVGTFAYCLLVLRSVRAGPGFIPSLSITLAIAMGVVAMGFLLAFIHHMSQAIQVSTITATVARSTLAAIGELYPASFGGEEEMRAEQVLREWHARGRPAQVYAERSGYVRTVDLEALGKAVEERPLLAHVAAAPGDFVGGRDPVVEVWGPDPADEGAARGLARAVVVADERDVEHDAGYGVRQLADIAMRALSPSVNDPTTAVTCVRYLREILARLAGRAFPSPVRRLAGDVVLVVRVRPFEEYVGTAFLQVGRYARDVRVAVEVIEAVTAVARAALDAGARARLAPLYEAAETTAKVALEEAVTDADSRRVETALERLRNPYGRPSSASAASWSATR